MATNVGEIIQKVAIFGVAGWLAENALCRQDRYSALFRGAKIPFLPLYAVNGVALTSMSSFVSRWPWLARGLAYALVGTAIEWLGCQVDRKLLGQRVWDYGRGEARTIASEGCVSFTRSALWGGVGLLAEKVT